MFVTVARNQLIAAPAATINRIYTDPIAFDGFDRVTCLLDVSYLTNADGFSYRVQASHDGNGWADAPCATDSITGVTGDPKMMSCMVGDAAFIRIVFALTGNADPAAVLFTLTMGLGRS